MPRETIEYCMDLTSADNKRRLQAGIGPLQGFYDVSIKPRKGLRSQRQNAFYFGVVVAALKAFLNDQGEMVDTDEAHNLMKAKFLRRAIIHHGTGEFIGQAIRSTAKLDVPEMSKYIQDCIDWQYDMFGIILPEQERFNDEPKET